MSNAVRAEKSCRDWRLRLESSHYIELWGDSLGYVFSSFSSFRSLVWTSGDSPVGASAGAGVVVVAEAAAPFSVASGGVSPLSPLCNSAMLLEDVTPAAGVVGV